MSFPAQSGGTRATAFQAKDFIETRHGLFFAVLDSTLEDNRVMAFLRYLKKAGQYHKFDTEAAKRYLTEHAPHHLFRSSRLDADVHGVPLAEISHHHQPHLRMMELRQTSATDAVMHDIQQLMALYHEHGIDLTSLGVTGSLLIGAQNPASDIDLVVYSRSTFQYLRELNQTFIQQGKLGNLNQADWQLSYQRRQCELSFDRYLWHEQRKFNKALINGRKFDLSLLTPAPESTNRYVKKGFTKITARVCNDQWAFDYPARYQIEHPDIFEIVSFTATYTGQALAGERLSAAGWLEQCQQTGMVRLVVGSSREAKGEFIEVISGD
ncbi:MAG: nucleotidyltransferase domain-containing protein [Methylococcales bacterium]|nr:nucleotidyltransferase domain-containing protein [Methylococcales bacterium]